MHAEGTDEKAPRGEILERLPVVAIVGRPNAGKSMLFNRLVHAPRAIVDSRPGVTRDRNIARGRWDGREFLLVDTGGFEDRDASTLAAAVRAQSALAAAEADAVIVLLDGQEGLNPLDRDFTERLRRLRKPVLYAVNKLDVPSHDDRAAEFFALGLEEVFPISAAHGRGVADLMERLVALLPAAPAAEADGARASGEGAVTLAIVGRPNVGKSSLLNRIVGYERTIVDGTPGTTRDAIDTPFRAGQQDYILVDTAGIRRRPRVQEHVERGSVVRALRTLERAEVAVLVLDALEGMTDQDARIASYAWERGRALLIVVNKWDAVPRTQGDRAQCARILHERYPTLAEVPVLALSARTGSHVSELFPALEALIRCHRRQVRTTELNRLLEAATQAQTPPSTRGKRARLLYATQTGTAPPTFTVFCSHPDLVPVSYQRYLVNTLRTAFELHGTPIRLRFREKSQAESRKPQAKQKAQATRDTPHAQRKKAQTTSRKPQAKRYKPRATS